MAERGVGYSSEEEDGEEDGQLRADQEMNDDRL
jgi:hypothetical protein